MLHCIHMQTFSNLNDRKKHREKKPLKQQFMDISMEFFFSQ